MAPRKKTGLKTGRNPDVTRLCRYCAAPHRETDYPEVTDWICQPCRERGILPIIPRVRAGEGQRYDTSTLFAGYRVFKVKLVEKGEGARAEYETEVRSPSGVFYPVAEAAFAFETRTAKMANILLRKFPQARVQARGDDGAAVLIFQADLDLFRQVAQKVGAYKRRQVSDETRAKLAAAREAAQEDRRPTLGLSGLETAEHKARQMGLDL